MTAATLPSDQEHRRKAAAGLGRNVVVSAGAGTGKTRLLIDRLTLLILGKEIPVEKIVALTFTKKAAEEMRDRLEKRLREIMADPDGFSLLNEEFPADAERRVLLAAKALDDIPKAQIGTIHSFAGHLLRLYPVQAEVDPAFREDDGTAFETMFESEWQSWLSEELAEASPRAARWAEWLAALKLSDLKELARSMAGAEDPAALPGEPIAVTALVDETLAALSGLVQRLGVPKKATAFAPRLDSLRRVLEAVRSGRRPDAGDLEETAELDPDAMPKDWAGDPEAVAVMTVVQRRAESLGAVDEKLVAAACDAVRPFVERLRGELRKRGSLSFDDLLVKARDLVRDHKKVRAALKAQYAAFLVDEFQDTDPLQGEILFYLAEEPGREASHWRDVELGPGRLFVVGDPKQSIYRFRGADIAAFEEFWNRLVQQGALRAALSCNFRSRPHILDTVNALFPAVMTHEKFVQPAYEALEAGRDACGPAGVEIVAVAVPSGEKASAEELRAFEGLAVADWIEKHVTEGLDGAPLRYGDVAILLRGTAAFQPYLDALRDRGIPFLAEGEKTYYHRPEVLELTNLLSVIANPDDKLSLAGVLRSPLGGLNDIELAELAAAGGLDPRRHPPFLKEKIGKLYETIRRLAGEAHAMPVPDLIQAAFDSTWLLEIAAGRRHGEQALANLRKVSLLAERWLEAGPMTLAAFVRRLRLYREDKKDEGENPLADVQFDAVRVMTIHKSKGLEFPVVFLPNLSAPSRASYNAPDVLRADWRTGRVGVHVPGVRAINAARVLIDEDVERREAAEEARVFYVAMTRAKERLVVIGRDRAKSGAIFAGFLTTGGAWPRVGADSVAPGGVEVPVRWISWTRGGPPSARDSFAGFTTDWDLPALADRLKKRALERAACRSARPVMTPTAALGARHAAGETEKRALNADDEAALDRTPAIMIGHICHAVMEGWDFLAPAAAAAKALPASIAAAAARFGLLPENPDREAIVKECADILTGFLRSEAFGRLAKSKIEAREVPFFYPLGTGDGPRVMRGVMDVVYSENGEIVVGDYKTNKVDEATIAAVAESYRAQGEAYVRAISQALGRKAQFELIFLRGGKAVRLGF